MFPSARLLLLLSMGYLGRRCKVVGKCCGVRLQPLVGRGLQVLYPGGEHRVQASRVSANITNMYALRRERCNK